MITRCCSDAADVIAGESGDDTSLSQAIISVKNTPTALMTLPPEMIVEILGYLSPDHLYQMKNINNSYLKTLCDYTLTYRSSKSAKQDALVYCAIDNDIDKLRFIIEQSLPTEINASQAAYSLALMLAINKGSQPLVLALLGHTSIPEGTFYQHVYQDAQAFIASLPAV